MRSRTLLPVLLCAVVFLALPAAAHAAIPFFGPIIDKAWFVSGTNPPIQCALGWGAVIVVINNVIQLLITIAIVFVAPMTIAYAGFLYVVNPVSPSGMSKAKGMLWNTVIGIVVALAAWMIVAAVMAVLYHPDKSTWEKWSDLITGRADDMCLKQRGVAPGDGLTQTVTPGIKVVTPDVPTAAPVGTATLSSAQILRAANAAKAYTSQVCTAASTQGIPTQCNQLLGILAIESTGVSTVRSSEGALGLMQLVPTTAASNGVSACVGSSNTSPSAACIAALKNPETNIAAGVAYYKKLFSKFGGNQRYATAAYNAGDGTGLKSNGKKPAFAPSSDCPGMYAWECPINPGGFVETQRYVLNVAAVAQQLGG